MGRFIFSVLVLASTATFASPRDELITTYIGSDKQPGTLAELFGHDVKLVNHYLYWENDGRGQSLNIEQLIAYFRFYEQKFIHENCKDAFNPGFTDDIREVVPLDTVRKIEFKFKNPSILYPKHKVSERFKADLAVFQLCQFSKLASLSLPFDPAGINGLNRNFAVPLDRIEKFCQGISHQIIQDVLNRKSTYSEYVKPAHLCSSKDTSGRKNLR